MRGPLVCIRGATLEGWLAAALLARDIAALGGRVVVAETAEDAPPPPSIQLSPRVVEAHRKLKLDDRDVVRFCAGAFAMGTVFEGFGPQSFSIGFGPVGASLDGVGFHHHWLRARALGLAGPHWRYGVAAAAAAEGRFRPPGEEDEFAYGLHLDGPRYQEFLKRCALHYGAESAGEAAGDLVIDAAGAPITLTRSGGIDRVSWGEGPTEPQLGAAVVVSAAGGYLVRTPLQTRTTIAYAHASAKSDPATVAALCGEGAVTRPVASGWTDHPWRGAVLAIGRSACDLEPFAAPEPHLTVEAAESLRELLTFDPGADAARAEYNRRLSATYARFSEFQCLRASLAGGGDAPERDSGLGRKREQFASRGRVVRYDYESFEDEDYVALFLGHGAIPARYDRLADVRAETELAAFMAGQAEAVRRAVEAMPDQRALLSRAGLATGSKEG